MYLLINFFSDLLLILWRQPHFVIGIKDQKAKLIKGKAPSGFIRNCEDIAKTAEIHQGLVLGLKRDYGIQLDFSSSIPKVNQQSFRNAWQVHS